MKTRTLMLRCPECGRYYFDWRKFNRHMIWEHDYKLPILPVSDEEGEESEATTEEVEA